MQQQAQLIAYAKQQGLAPPDDSIAHVQGTSTSQPNGISTIPEQQEQLQQTAASTEDGGSAYAGRVGVVTAVWRAGRAGASTDHSSICYNIDADTSELSEGVTANHWYVLGLKGLGIVDPAAQEVWHVHPDSRRQITGESA
eukprot:GHRR01009616.1.p1 GENE.GHRR01009616.1~~GHRR01009616.1.p1  ORF type:complete len:141 (-),score=60.57 GHRR01009616.1:2054-2476(-)